MTKYKRKALTLALVLAAIVWHRYVLADDIALSNSNYDYISSEVSQTASDQGLQPYSEDAQSTTTASSAIDPSVLSWPRAQYQDPELNRESRPYYDDKLGRRVDVVVPRASDNVQGLKEISIGDGPTYAGLRPATTDVLLSLQAPVAQTRLNADKVAFLIHGAIQGPWAWSYPGTNAPRGVRGILEDYGYRVFAPTTPYHEPFGRWNADLLNVRAKDYVDHFVRVFEENDLQNVMVVSHSMGGIWSQLLFQEVPERINRLVFVSALVLENGESFLTNAVGQPIQALFTTFAGVPFFPVPLDRSTADTPMLTLDVGVWQEFLMNTVENQTVLFDTYSKLVPEPRGPLLEVLDLTRWYIIPKPKFYVAFKRDMSMGPDISAHPWMSFASRLNQTDLAGVPSQVFWVDSCHEGMLASPMDLAVALLNAFEA